MMVPLSRVLFVIYFFVNVFVQWRCASTPSADVTDVTGAVPFGSFEGDNTTNISTSTPQTSSTEVPVDNPSDYCPDGLPCPDLSQACLTCVYNTSCVYGRPDVMTCTVKDPVQCQGNRTFTREFTCRYCYQVEHWLYTCSSNLTCAVVSSPPRPTYVATCTMKPDVNCMGRRTFHKKMPCNWTSGYRWSTALALSITLGGLGADRFYLGLWRAGLGKLFSFGGLGVWTIVDVILVAIGYVGPSDGSVYMR